jgi:DTW domain-containing protein YfiP
VFRLQLLPFSAKYSSPSAAHCTPALPVSEPPEGLQVLLLDGTWIQSTGMLRGVESWGRRVSLPMAGESRYWLRSQAADDRFSTIEALMFLMAALGMAEQRAALQLQFELHVYAGLCARGKKVEAANYLSPAPWRFPSCLGSPRS